MNQPHPVPNQDRIWAHFQNLETPEAFALAKPRLDFLLRQIGRRAGSSPRVLNIGVGSGYLERQGHKRGWEMHSLDPDSRSMERLAAEGIATHIGYIEAMPLESGAFDVVVASEVLEHLTDAQRAGGVREIARVLRPGAWFLGTVPWNENLHESTVVCPRCGEVFHRWGHHKSFDLPDISTELSPHFEIATLRRTAFVSFRDRRLGGKLKSLLRLALARAGQMIAVPSIYWAARKRAAKAADNESIPVTP